jgi:hypothetical protein
VIKLGELVMILDLHRQGLSVSAIYGRCRKGRRPWRNRALKRGNAESGSVISLSARRALNRYVPPEGLGLRMLGTDGMLERHCRRDE